MKQGLESKGIQVKLFQVQETLSDEILSKMQAPPKLDLPIIKVDQLSEADGIIFGLPTRFGTMPAQIKAFLDTTGPLWARGELTGKFAATFFSTASQHGGQETTALTAVTYFAHHGMLYVPFGFAHAAMMSDIDQVIGGSPYGCGTVSDGDGSRQPTDIELGIALQQGVTFGEVVTTFVQGRDIVVAEDTITSTDDSGSIVAGSTTESVPAGIGAIGSQDKEATNTVDNTTGVTDATGVTNTATEIGASAGAIAAGQSNLVKESIINNAKEKKPKRSKWFCCG